MCVSEAHSRIQHLKLRLFVHTQVAFVDFFFFKVSSNFHIGGKKSTSHKEWESYYLESAEILVLTPFSTKRSQRSLTVVPKTVSFKKTSAINMEYLCRHLEQKLRIDIWQVEKCREKNDTKKKPLYFRNTLCSGVEWLLAQNLSCP